MPRTRGGRTPPGLTRASERVRLAEERLARVLAAGNLDSELMVPQLVPGFMDLAVAAAGRIQGDCVDVCFTVRGALAHYGIRAQLRAVDLLVEDSATGRHALYGTPDPYWQDDVLVGHCALWLPGHRIFIDPTVERFPQVAKLAMGPVIGKERRAGLEADVPLPLCEFQVRRGDSLLLYNTAGEEAAATILGGDHVILRTEAYARSGILQASLAIEAIRTCGLAAQVIARTPYPRVRALLETIGDAPGAVDERGEWRFELTGPGGIVRRLRLDEIPLSIAVAPVC
ncbi:MAG: hypothetical protein ABIS86_16910 [Streptosporangiaceae bacterium]